jgi:rubrerythrin
MNGSSVTTAAIISLSEELEDISSAFYDQLAERWTDHKQTFSSFSLDGRKNKIQIVRTYQETITDALEASYSFEGFNPQAYRVDTALNASASYAEGLRMAVALEQRACAFYEDVAERSESLLATIPRAFRRVAKQRGQRGQKLEAMLKEA